MATLGSHRVSTDPPLVRLGAPRAIIRCSIVHDERELLVELEITPGKANRARIGRAPATRARDVLGALRLVLFAPEDLALVRGDPAERRRYLDDLLVQRQPRFAGVRADYERVLKQRNALLRTAYLARKVNGRGAGGDLSTLDVWDLHLAAHGAELVVARLELCAALGTYLAKSYDAVSAGRGEARVAYDAKSWCETPLGRARPGGCGATAAGVAGRVARRRGGAWGHPGRPAPRRPGPQPRRLPAKGYASHGECWSYALALRLAPFELMRGRGHRAGARARRCLRRARQRPAGATRRPRRRREPGAGHLRRRRRHPGGAAGPATPSATRAAARCRRAA